MKSKDEVSQLENILLRTFPIVFFLWGVFTDSEFLILGALQLYIFLRVCDFLNEAEDKLSKRIKKLEKNSVKKRKEVE